MPDCEFEEKEYETQMTIELARPPAGRRYLASAGQHLKKLLGYDAAMDPAGSDPIWQALNVERPAAVRLLPTMFARDAGPPSARLPPQPISLLLQFKRPYHVTRRRGSLPPAPVPLPVYRVEVSVDQHAVLRRLEPQLMGEAVIRYAAPAFHTIVELEAARLRDEAVARSSYVSPSQVDLHTYWYYDGPGTGGWANPEPVELPVEDVEMLFGALETGSDSPLVGQRDLGDHLRAMANAMRTADNTTELYVDRWIQEVRTAVPILKPGRLERLRQLASVATFVERQQLVWLLVGEPPRDRASAGIEG